MVRVELSVPYPYNPGEYRISQKVVGPRGGVSWRVVHSQPDTGGEVHLSLEPGEYKETYWSNGFPSSKTFTVQE